MKIQLNNFGPIKKFDFDLSKDLTVVFGKNNIGKSYAISAVYLILKALRIDEIRENRIQLELFYYRRVTDSEFGGKSSRILKEILALEESVIKAMNLRGEIEINAGLKKIFTNVITDFFVHNLEKSFSSSFSSIDSLKNKMTKKRLSILIQFKSFEFNISVSRGKLVITNLIFYEKIVITKSLKTRKSERKDGQYLLYYNISKKNKSQIIDALFLEYYSSFTQEINTVINNIYFLPASRSGLYQALSAFNAVIAELSKSRTFLSNKLELPNISEPVLDYFLSLANVSDKNTSKKYLPIVELIEKNILGGTVSFNEETRKLTFSPANIGGDLDLAFTSSMISEIAPIVAFFKYIIPEVKNKLRHYLYDSNTLDNASHLIFIEEPEAHLHPEIQVLLMEVFSVVITQKVKIVMTSHSNYMFNKLSNLILENKIPHENIASYHMIMESEGSVADVVSMAANSDGIVDNNFADVAEMLYKERIDIYNELNKNIDVN